MKKKVFILVVVLMCSMLMLLTGCNLSNAINQNNNNNNNNQEEEHNHTFTEEWFFDENIHWHKCSECDERENMQDHYGYSGRCDFCHFVFETTSLKFTLNEDGETYYVETAMPVNDEGIIYIKVPAQYQGKAVNKIGISSFQGYGSPKIEEVIISEGILSVSKGAFEYTKSLKKLVLPASLKYIGENAFYSSSLQTINFNGTKAQWNAIEKAENWDNRSVITIIKCSDGDITITRA